MEILQNIPVRFLTPHSRLSILFVVKLHLRFLQNQSPFLREEVEPDHEAVDDISDADHWRQGLGILNPEPGIPESA